MRPRVCGQLYIVVGASAAGATAKLDLWRGMRDLTTSAAFTAEGGSEIAPMSTTTSLAVALHYADSKNVLLFKLRTDSFMGRGASIRFLSAFPGEDEVLFPPLTYLQTSSVNHFTHSGRRFEVVEVVPHFGSS